jgi:hypothetical protein
VQSRRHALTSLRQLIDVPRHSAGGAPTVERTSGRTIHGATRLRTEAPFQCGVRSLSAAAVARRRHRDLVVAPAIKGPSTVSASEIPRSRRTGCRSRSQRVSSFWIRTHRGPAELDARSRRRVYRVKQIIDHDMAGAPDGDLHI